MKKFIAVFTLFTIVLSLISCDVNDRSKFDVAETKKIALGKEVDSVVLTTSDGEKITCNSGNDFYEIFNKVSLTNEAGKKYSHVAETKMEDNSKSFTNMNYYILANGQFFEITTKKEGDEAFSVIEEYSYHKQLSDQAFENRSFVRYTYKEEKAFGGTVHDANGYKVYSSNAYPLIPGDDTELHEMQVRSNYVKMLLAKTSLFEHFEPYEENNQTYDFDAFVTREYTLYENYIVFKQTAPFLYFYYTGQGSDSLYASVSKADCSITQEAYCNVKTGEIEFIKIYGDTLWYLPEYWGQRMEINATIYIHDVSESESKQKVSKLIEYVEANADE